MGTAAKVRGAAAAAAISHVAAAVAGFFILRPGRDPGHDAATRQEYVSKHPDAWPAAWMLFVVAAFAMIWMVIAVRRRADPQQQSGVLQGAVAFTVLGAAVETAGHCLSSALPLVSGEAALAITRAADLMAGTVAALAFGTGMLLLVLGLRRVRAAGALAVIGYANAAGSAVMAGATLFRKDGLAGLGAMIVIATVVIFAVALLTSGWSRDLVSEP